MQIKKIMLGVLVFFSISMMLLPSSSFALLSMELTQGVAGAIPIAIVPFADSGSPSEISNVITNDLKNSGRFKVYGAETLKEFPHRAQEVHAAYFRGVGADNVVVGSVVPAGGGRYKVSFELLEAEQETGNKLLVKEYTVSANELRKVAHHISDLIYEKMTGIRGVFSTRLAYVVVERDDHGKARHILEVSDQDGYSPRALLNSPEPIMSPAWSPNGRQLAYVSFEGQRARIYLQDVASGGRRAISDFPGINGAPAWSRDGRKLAVVLSKSGSPNIYIMDIASHSLTPLTQDFYINTEPSWSPDGQSILFTSNRGGGPQVYQINLRSKAVSRLSFDGDYNARASYSADGEHVVMIHRAEGVYKIAVLDLNTGTIRALTRSAQDNASPSIAPNGSMILYDTAAHDRNVLGMVSIDGRVQLLLPARTGNAQDPAWSPYLG